MLTVFSDSQGVLLEDYLEKSCTMNSARYSDLLVNTLKPAIQTKRYGLLSLIVEKITKLGFEVFQHSAYSSDLVHSDFHTFGHLKNPLPGC